MEIPLLWLGLQARQPDCICAAPKQHAAASFPEEVVRSRCPNTDFSILWIPRRCL